MNRFKLNVYVAMILAILVMPVVTTTALATDMPRFTAAQQPVMNFTQPVMPEATISASEQPGKKLWCRRCTTTS